MILFKFIKNKKRFILPICIWMILSFILLIFNNIINKQFEVYVLDTTSNLSTESSYNINSYINNKLNILSTISYQLSEDELLNPEKIIKNFQNIVSENNWKMISITSLDGIAYTSNGQKVDVSDRDYFLNAKKGEKFVSTIVTSKLDGKSSNVFSVPIFRNNEVVAVLWASILTDTFYENLNLKTMHKFGDTFILDSNGDIIASSKKMNLYSDDLNFFSHIDNIDKIKDDFLKLQNNYIKVPDYNSGNDTILYYSKIDHADWWLLTAIPIDNIRSSYSSIVLSINQFNIGLLILFSILFIIYFIKEKKAYKNINSIAYTDTITNGKNDVYLKNNLHKIINKKNNFAFISLEITNIKTLINILGFKNMNFLIKNIYEYLLSLISTDEIVVHSYLGEFKLIFKYTDTNEICNRLKNISFSKINETIDFKIGIYLIDKENIDFEEMCSFANIAKESIVNSKYMFYTKYIHNSEIKKNQLIEDINNGIKNKEFKAWFQPKYSKDGKTIIGAEALVRWYKYGTIISPYIFIPICESNGLIKEIDELVFEDVCKTLNKWIKSNKKVVPISINLSRNYLNNVKFIDILNHYLDLYKIPTNLINFEITESSLIENEKLLQNTISILHEKGFKVLLDDFGVGYSSIKAISDINFDVLKIDKSFIDGIGEEKWNNIIKFTIKLANNLGMKTIAEGIETQEQYKFLVECNCDIFQGYYFNKPMSPEDFSKLI